MRVLVFGTFDRLHPGHTHFLTEALKRGELSVVIARDRNVERIKKIQPTDDETARLHAVHLAVPDAQVILGDPEDFLAPVRRIQPDLILFGYDQRLPPGVREEDLPCATERLSPYHPEKFKSSIQRETRFQKPESIDA